MDNKTFFGRTERRATKRYPVFWPVQFPNGFGRSFNISSAGLSVETSLDLEIGMSLTFALILPELCAGCSLRCEGKVTRVDIDGEQIRAGVRLLEFRFDRLSQVFADRIERP